jgi:AcrR family transcriptional regulator
MSRQESPQSVDGSARDGRVLRTERSRAKMVKAFFDLVGEGFLQPTAQQVAERAEVGIRTVFRHFSEMDTLFAEVDAMLREQVGSAFLECTVEGDLVERASSLVRNRSAVFERFAPYLRATRLYRQRSGFLDQQFTTFVKRQRRHLLAQLPELEHAPRELTDAIEVVTSFEAWDRLRADQRLGAARTTAALVKAVTVLIGELEG